MLKLKDSNNLLLNPNTVKLSGKKETKVLKIDRIAEISYDSFYNNYLKPNKPCIISSSATENWTSRRDWVTAEGKPNFDFLLKAFGKATVPVADCDKREFNSQCKSRMSFPEYLSYWQNLSSSEDKNSPCFYLKDFHFLREDRDYNAYVIPDYFHSDWLNEYCETQSDDFKFVYMGPKETWTPLHSDVFGSYSWSANICGRKRWLLIQPGQENRLKDKHRQLPCSYEMDLSKYGVSYIDIIQESGEIIFVPSGWYHQVWNLVDTISINHNWFNGCNLSYIWFRLKESALDVEKEIEDCKDSEDFQSQCQILLKVHHGMDYKEFLQILKFILNSRIRCLESLNTEDYSKNWEILFDIEAIQQVCEEILADKHNATSNFLSEVKDLLSCIPDFLTKIDAQ